MNQKLYWFLEDLIKILQDQYKDAAAEEVKKVSSEGDQAFNSGRAMAYYDVLDIIQSQLIAFGYNPDKFGSFVPDLSELARNHSSVNVESVEKEEHEAQRV